MGKISKFEFSESLPEAGENPTPFADDWVSSVGARMRLAWIFGENFSAPAEGFDRIPSPS